MRLDMGMRLGLAIAALLVVAACGGSGSESESGSVSPTATKAPTIKIATTVVAMNTLAMGAEALEDKTSSPTCEEMTGDYEALRSGEQIKLEDASGEIVAVAPLEKSPLNPGKHLCAWDAEFVDVPAGGKYYSVSIGKWKSDAETEEHASTKRIVLNTAR